MFPENTKPVNKKGNLALIYILSAVVVLLGGLMFGSSFAANDPAVEADGLTAQELSISEDYLFSELIVIDYYATDVRNEDDMYLYVAFFDENDKAYVASFSPKMDDALLAQLGDYLNDDSAYVGDLTFPAAVDVKNLSALEDDAQGFYKELLPDVEEIFTSIGLEVESTELHFDYQGADQAAYAKSQSKEDMTMRIAGGVIALVGVFMFLFFPKSLKKRWAQMEAIAAEPSVVNVQPEPARSVINVVSAPREEAPTEEE